MEPRRIDFALTVDELRLVTRFAADSAEGVLASFEAVHPSDGRPRVAIETALQFVNGAPRSNRLRTAAWEAHRAAQQTSDEIARHAAIAAADAAAAPYLHPIERGTQVGHILRAAANAAYIAELRADGDTTAATSSIQSARRRATPELIDVLRRYPRPSAQGARVARLMWELDSLLRDTR